jgi:hypothetical protein
MKSKNSHPVKIAVDAFVNQNALKPSCAKKSSDETDSAL